MRPEQQQQARTWATSLRIEQRYGALRYVVLFSDGRLTASLFGSVDDSVSSRSAEEIAWQVAAGWLSHVRPQPKRRRSTRKQSRECRREIAA